MSWRPSISNRPLPELSPLVRIGMCFSVGRERQHLDGPAKRLGGIVEDAIAISCMVLAHASLVSVRPGRVERWDALPMKNSQAVFMVKEGPTVENVLPSVLYEKVAVWAAPGAMDAEMRSHSFVAEMDVL